MTAGGPAAFDVVSIREHGGDDHMERWMNKPDGMSTTNIPLQSLIASAYGIKMDLVSGGPSWVNSKGFDVEAKLLPEEGSAPAKLSQAQREAMLRALLIDRFHLKAHVESKILPIYELAVAKDGPKIKPALPQPPATDGKPGDFSEPGSMNFAPGHLEAHEYLISSLADQLGYIVQRTTLDKTDLTQPYTFTLDWTPDEQLQAAGDKAATGTEAKPSIYAALREQLGLKLVPAKGPVNTLVIDHVELPTAN